MVGKYNVIQAKILNPNSLAKYIPCVAHCLNFTGVHAAPSTRETICFFGNGQRLFISLFSSSSTQREILMKSLNATLKGYVTLDGPQRLRLSQKLSPCVDTLAHVHTV